MENADASRVALYYDDSAYRETLQRERSAKRDGPMGLMGRQVAGKSFLDAYLTHGDWEQLVTLTPNAASAASIKETCRNHPSSRKRARRLRVFSTAEFHSQFLDNPPAPVLHFPCPAEPRLVWARQSQSASFAVCGVTHTLCSARAIESLQAMITAPFESYDRLICTSRAVKEMVQATCDTYCEYLTERLGGRPKLRLQLELIPLGVDTSRYQPATPAQRRAQRQRFQIADDELAVLFVGRLAHHAKAHPFPLYEAAARTAATGQKVHLLLAGWAPSNEVLREFQRAAREIAGSVRVSFLDGLREEVRFGVWEAADVFLSPSDNIQETFGLVIIEAMAAGLPVVASDWNGYRDLVEHGTTGFLVPTSIVSESTAGLTSRLLTGELNYDQFLAAASQSVRVDPATTAMALTKLAESTELRQRMGEAGRQRALERFCWSRIIPQYEQLWDQQRAELHSQREPRQHSNAPAAYPPIEQLFHGYPTQWLDGSTQLVATPAATERLPRILTLPLCTHAANERCSDRPTLIRLLEAVQSPVALADIEVQLRDEGVDAVRARATLGWLLKYDLLTVVETEA